jgi:hypothetical protein
MSNRTYCKLAQLLRRTPLKKFGFKAEILACGRAAIQRKPTERAQHLWHFPLLLPIPRLPVFVTVHRAVWTQGSDALSTISAVAGSRWYAEEIAALTQNAPWIDAKAGSSR